MPQSLPKLVQLHSADKCAGYESVRVAFEFPFALVFCNFAHFTRQLALHHPTTLCLFIELRVRSTFPRASAGE